MVKLDFGDGINLMIFGLAVLTLVGYWIGSIELINALLTIATILMAGFVAHQAWATYGIIKQSQFQLVQLHKQVELEKQSLDEMKKQRLTPIVVNAIGVLRSLKYKLEKNFDLISPRSGNDYLLHLDPKMAVELLNKLDEFIVDNYDYFLIDLGAGIHKINQLIFSSVDYPILVLNPNIMSIIDAYGVIKTVFSNYRRTYYYAVVNQIRDKRDYTKTVNVLEKSAKSFHKNIHVEGLGYIPYSPKVAMGEIPKDLFKYADTILENLLRDGYKKETKGSFWGKLASFFRR